MKEEEYVEYCADDYEIFTSNFVCVKSFSSEYYKIYHFDDEGIYVNHTKFTYKDALSYLKYKDGNTFGKLKK
jgi:hypothetical protein